MPILTPPDVGRSNGYALAAPSLSDQIDIWLGHNQDAITFCKDMLYIVARWDDLVDRDEPLSDAEICKLMETTLSLPLNPFYIANFASLHTLMHNSIRNWKAANAIERNPESTELALMQAFVFRSSYRDILAHAVMLLAGNESAEQLVIEIRTNPRWNEDFAAYKVALIREKEIRDGVRK